MDHFFDQAARILADPVPRRQALKRLGALVSGGILLWANGTKGQSLGDCTTGCTVIGAGYTNGMVCCQSTGSIPNFCAKKNEYCCGNSPCIDAQQCCTGVGAGVGPSGAGALAYCAPDTWHCCGSQACIPPRVCCTGSFTCCKECTPTGQCADSPS